MTQEAMDALMGNIVIPETNAAAADADLVIECRKMAVAHMREEDFVDLSEVAPKWYDAENPMHLVYICEIAATYIR